jgi:hypothetical protein
MRSLLHEKAPRAEAHRQVRCSSEHLPGVGLLRPFSDTLDPNPSLAPPRSSSLTTPTPPTTTTLACRPSYTIADPLHRGQTLLVSPLPSATPNLVHRLAGLLPEASSTHLAVSNRQIPASRHRLARLMPFPYFSSSGQKCRVGQATLLAGWAVSLLVQPTATVVFLFYTFD